MQNSEKILKNQKQLLLFPQITKHQAFTKLT